MRLNRIIALICILLLMPWAYCQPFVFAASFTENTTTELLAFEDYEGYDVGYEMSAGDNFAYGNPGTTTAVDKTDVVSFAGNKCVSIDAGSALRAEAWQLINYDTATMSTVVTGFSIYADEMAGAMYYTVKTGEYGDKSFSLAASGKVKLGNTDTEIILSKDTWYDVIIEHVPKDGYVRAHIKGGEIDAFCEDSFTPTENTKDTARVTFIADKVSDSQNPTRVYIDNFYVYASNKKPSEYVNAVDGYTFEDFVAASDGLTFPAGMVPDNANNYLELRTKESESHGKYLEIKSNAKKYPSLRTTISQNGLSGKSILEFDFMASANCKTRFGVRGVDSAGASAGDTVHLVVLEGNGKVKGQDNSLSVDTWYHYKFEFDTDLNTWKVTITSPGKTTIEDGGDITVRDGKKPLYKIKQMDFFTYGAISTDYVDNIYFVPENIPFGISSIEDANSLITPEKTSIKVGYSASINNNIENCVYKINGKKDMVDVSVVNSQATLTFKTPLEYGKHYLLEVCGIDKNGKEFYAVTSMRTIKELDISDFSHSVPSMQAGSIMANCSITPHSLSYTDATIITLLIDKQTGAIVSVDFDAAVLTKDENAILNTSVSVPSQHSSYKLVSYLWDTLTDMNSLCEPIVLE